MNGLLRRGSKNLLRDINNSRVLQIIQSHAPVSRAEIARIAELPPPTVTSIVNDFLRVGLIHETDLVQDANNGSPGLGRRPIFLELNRRVALTVGVKLRSNGLTVAITDLAGTVEFHADLPVASVTPAEILAEVATKIRWAIAECGLETDRILGIGLGMPGVIDHRTGVCRYSPLLGWGSVEVGPILEELCAMRVYVDNDVNMLTASQIAFGHGRGVNSLLTVTLGTGIGLGIGLGGEIYRGSYGGAGEFGHLKVGGTRVCDCGALGCLESMASERGVCQQAAELLGRTVGLDEVSQLATDGDHDILDMFQKTGSVLGTSIGNLVNIFNPDLVIITGEGVKTTAPLIEPMRAALDAAIFGTLGDELKIVVEELGDEAWAQGAASIVVHELLRPPIYKSHAAEPLAHFLDRGSDIDQSTRVNRRWA
ncbi:MAG TPA: ROK family transcriptional regulator [Chloroflexota bacterium]|jgi:predicted NBD/HSP70 family sugar kinase|nr:ROK family transcriptional regulator [Chloroflexota bacterium]